MIKKLIYITRAISILVILFILFLFAMIEGGFLSWFLFYSFLPVTVYLLLFFVYPIRFWCVYRKINQSMFQAGDTVTITIEIKRSIPFPIQYCIVEDIIPLSLRNINTRKEKYQYPKTSGTMTVDRRSKKILSPLFKRNFKYSYTLDRLPRGIHHLNTVSIRTSDVFGLLKKQYSISVQQSISVYPYIHDIKINNQVSGEGEGGITAKHRHFLNITGSSGVREYIPGDKMTWIDWKQTARNREMMTKEFDQEQSRDICLIHYNFLNDSYFPIVYEASLEISTSLVEAFNKNGIIVRYISIGRRIDTFDISPGTNQKAVLNHYLMNKQADQGSISASKLKDLHDPNEPGHIILILTTGSHVTPDTLTEIKKRIRNFSVLYMHMGRLSDSDKEIIYWLKNSNISLHELSLKSLSDDPVEVNLL